MKKITLTTLLAVISLLPTFSQPRNAADSVHFLLDTTIHIMKRKALYADRVKWESLREELQLATASVTAVKEAAFAFTRLYDELNDAHGAFFYADTVFRSQLKIKNIDKINEATNQELRKGPKLIAQMLPGNFAFIRIPFVAAQDTASVIAFSNRLNDSVVNLLQHKPKGLIIDLRLNQGGNMYPMIAGLRSLYAEGKVSDAYSYEWGDEPQDSVYFRNDSLISGYYKIPIHNYRDHRHTPVAVLIGPSTASAGECVAASLTFRQGTVLMGEESMGLTNGNDGFMLAPGIGFNLAVGVLKNGKGERLYEVIQPDIWVPGGDNFEDLMRDAKVKAAMEWMGKRE
ncbi:MAG TPA: S41 family peptidase [Phnomibacter sp.]|nr:S41 family peptidase [Phnomibacter sp.]